MQLSVIHEVAEFMSWKGADHLASGGDFKGGENEFHAVEGELLMMTEPVSGWKIAKAGLKVLEALVKCFNSSA
jgi:microsomal dipeptidase-like Zn-dependent dipeptidase